MAEVRRFHSPFRHWVLGVLIEVALYAAFIAVCFVAAVVLALIA